jgi:hypothetical protein
MPQAFQASRLLLTDSPVSASTYKDELRTWFQLKPNGGLPRTFMQIAHCICIQRFPKP